MTILTKQTACDEKAPVKIAIPPETSESEETETDLPLNNNNIIYVSRLLIRLMFSCCWLECWRNWTHLGLSIGLCVIPPYTPRRRRFILKNRFQFVLLPFFYFIDIEIESHRSFGNRSNCHSFVQVHWFGGRSQTEHDSRLWQKV